MQKHPCLHFSGRTCVQHYFHDCSSSPRARNTRTRTPYHPLLIFDVFYQNTYRRTFGILVSERTFTRYKITVIKNVYSRDSKILCRNNPESGFDAMSSCYIIAIATATKHVGCQFTPVSFEENIFCRSTKETWWVDKLTAAGWWHKWRENVFFPDWLKVQQNTVWCPRFLYIKTSFNFKKSIVKYSITDTSCTGYPMTTEPGHRRPKEQVWLQKQPRMPYSSVTVPSMNR